ncbi:MAG: radical SAM protein [Bacteroidaceae bacterium]|nr:radical SAM protein [Bacteroidaceae bacterium]
MSTLSQNNIYKLSLEEEFGRKDLYMLYAPVAGNMLIASTEECTQIENAILSGTQSPEMQEIVDSLTIGEPANQRDSKVNNVDEFLRMYILPNFICNFACSYCFSAKGRSNKALKKEHLKAALDYFIDSKRVASPKLAISYLGGGEPTISWDIVKFGLEYGAQKAKEHGIELMTTIVTNGSRITDEMVETFNLYNVKVRVSFEILEHIQNKQRGQYINVCRGLDKLAACTTLTMVRSMITPENVTLMPAMIEELHQRFPHVKSVLFDPITSNETFSEVESTRKFYDTYYTKFLEARALAATYGIDLCNAPLRNLNMVVERFCTGEFCLTPEGTITVCHQVSSPNEAKYNDYVYAQIDNDNNLQVDEDKFKKLISNNTIYTNPKCSNCFVKWNCGGGCMMQNNQYTPEILDVICDFTRRFSKTLLIERLKEQYAASGETLEDYIADNY